MSHEQAARRSWTVATVAAILMVLLAMTGVGLTTTAPATARIYWVFLVPVFGLICVLTAWLRSGPNRPVDRRAVLRQVFHWLGIALAVWIDFFILRIGEESRVAAGMNALMVLTLGCYLAGIHMEVLFLPVAVLLMLTLTLVGKIDQYQWLIFVVGGIALASVLLMRWGLGRWHARRLARTAAAAPAGS